MYQLLPLGYRTVLNLYAIEGYSHKEIAKMLEIEESTSRSQYTRAKAMLEDVLVKKKNNTKTKSKGIFWCGNIATLKKISKST
jgi:RNA polymerase sigma-70 factor (ECF subfamily)